jgi:alpha-amylase
MQNLPSCQQGIRYQDYGNTRVYRTVPFVNSHDTYRPLLTPTGNFLSYLGDNSGWDVGNELGGNGQHIDSRDPRLDAAYAAVFALDGNPAVYFEDLFDIGTTGQRWSHMPADSVALPIRSDIKNIIQAHQKLGFKDGVYAVPTAATGTAAPVYNKGTSGDHLVIERVGKAIIGISDAYNAVSDHSLDQEVWVTVGTPSWYNTDLIDYSGGHDTSKTHVFSDGRVLIKTAPCGNTIPGAHGHGYSIWAPVPAGITFNSVNDIYNYLTAYTPSRAAITTQEWEMADDLGDSHCKSLGQGGRIPDNATNERVVGRVFAQGGLPVNCSLKPEVDGNNLTLTAYGTNGLVLATVSGIATAAAPLTLNYTPAADGWVVVKVRNTSGTYSGQRCWVDVTYSAPAVVNTSGPASVLPTNVSIWTGNKGTSDMTDCGNWEGGLVPGTTSHVIVYGHAKPFPICTANTTVNKVTLFPGAQLTVTPGIDLTVLSQ